MADTADSGVTPLPMHSRAPATLRGTASAAHARVVGARPPSNRRRASPYVREPADIIRTIQMCVQPPRRQVMRSWRLRGSRDRRGLRVGRIRTRYAPRGDMEIRMKSNQSVPDRIWPFPRDRTIIPPTKFTSRYDNISHLPSNAIIRLRLVGTSQRR